MLTGAATALLILIALLAIPVELRFDISWYGSLNQRVRIVWAFGLVRADIPAPKRASRERRTDAVTNRKRSRDQAPRHRRTNPLAALRLPRFRRRVARSFAVLWRCVHKENVVLRLRVGCGDPADTGRLWALLGPASGMLALVPAIAVSLEPEFNEWIFELDASGTVRVSPVRVLVIVIALILSPSFWQGVRKLRAAE